MGVGSSLAVDPTNQAVIDDIFATSAEVPLPKVKDLFFPAGYQVLIMPRRCPEKSQGGIILTDTTAWKEQWLNYIGQIIGLGPLAFKSQKWRQQGLDPDKADWLPKRGEYWAYRPYQVYRLQYRNIKFLACYDTNLIGRIPEGNEPWHYLSGADAG